MLLYVLCLWPSIVKFQKVMGNIKTLLLLLTQVKKPLLKNKLKKKIMAFKTKVFLGGFPKMGSTNFRGLLMPGQVVKKTSISKAKGVNLNGNKKKQLKKK